jgi:hypothetical protein
LEPDPSALDAFLHCFFYQQKATASSTGTAGKPSCCLLSFGMTRQHLHCEQLPEGLLSRHGSFAKHVSTLRCRANEPSGLLQRDPQLHQGSMNTLQSTTFVQVAGQTSHTDWLDYPTHHRPYHVNGSLHFDAHIATASCQHGEGITWNNAQVTVMIIGLKVTVIDVVAVQCLGNKLAAHQQSGHVDRPTSLTQYACCQQAQGWEAVCRQFESTSGHDHRPTARGTFTGPGLGQPLAPFRPWQQCPARNAGMIIRGGRHASLHNGRTMVAPAAAPASGKVPNQVGSQRTLSRSTINTCAGSAASATRNGRNQVPPHVQCVPPRMRTQSGDARWTWADISP